MKRVCQQRARGFAVAAILFFQVDCSFGYSGFTPDDQFLFTIRLGIIQYQQEHHRELPARWNDLDPYLEGGVAEIAKKTQGTERYALLSPPIPLKKPFQGELIVVTRRPYSEIFFSDYGERKRFAPVLHRAIVRTVEGEIDWKKFTVSEMADIYGNAGVPAVAPDSLPERERLVTFRRELQLRPYKKTVSAILVVLIPVLFYAIGRRLWLKFFQARTRA